MSHSLPKVWIHSIWSTKDRMSLIHSEIEQLIYNYLKEQFQEMNCTIKIINGMPDHVHALFLLNPQKQLSEIIKQVKGSSSHHINQ